MYNVSTINVGSIIFNRSWFNSRLNNNYMKKIYFTFRNNVYGITFDFKIFSWKVNKKTFHYSNEIDKKMNKILKTDDLL